MHSANHGFRDEPEVSLDDFLEWHSFINTQIERDCEFRNLLIGVWNMDMMQDSEAPLHSTTNFVDPSIAGVRQVAFPARNSHEQWKHDFHRSQFGHPTIVEHQFSEKEKEAQKA